jgi:hypothetical protein
MGGSGAGERRECVWGGLERDPNDAIRVLVFPSVRPWPTEIWTRFCGPFLGRRKQGLISSACVGPTKTRFNFVSLRWPTK